MKDPYNEGIANHIGPESCVGDRKGADEALTGGGVGRAIEPREVDIRDADVLGRTEGNTGCTANRKGQRVPRGQRTPARSDRFLRENREIPALAVGITVRAVNPMGATRR